MSKVTSVVPTFSPYLEWVRMKLFRGAQTVDRNQSWHRIPIYLNKQQQNPNSKAAARSKVSREYGASSLPDLDARGLQEVLTLRASGTEACRKPAQKKQTTHPEERAAGGYRCSLNFN